MRAGLGILESVGLIGSLLFAVPAGVAGVGMLLDGRTAVGATLVVVAVLMVVVPRRVVGPGDLPGDAAARLVGRAVLDPEDHRSGTDGAAGRDGSDGATNPEGDDVDGRGESREDGRRDGDRGR